MEDQIDYLWIISNHALASGPQATVSGWKRIRYSTRDQFRSWMMNFNNLLAYNRKAFAISEAFRYYIPSRAKGTDINLSDIVSEWLQVPQNGMLIYGGYGLGKTTFSKHLAADMSERYQGSLISGDFSTRPRIPIRIELGGMYTKQDITALICSTLNGAETAMNVPGFTFNLFLEGNEKGDYLLIFDGFDEMRHAMSLEDFRFTFEQFQMLLNGNSKVILLGRPDTFLTSKEEKYIISSMFDEPRYKKRVTTVEVDFFSTIDIQIYLQNYFLLKSTQFSKKKFEKLYSLIGDGNAKSDLLARPVQLFMFTKIFEDLVDEKSVNRYVIYDRFIYRFIYRELTKKARKGSREGGFDDRAQFMQAVAWWIINDKKENRFSADEIPLEYIPSSMRKDRDYTSSLREALVSSVIELYRDIDVLGKKGNRFYYFPHKSYIEFLTAQYFTTREFEFSVFKKFLSNMNPEVLSFIAEGPDSGVSNLRRGLDHMLGNVDFSLVSLVASHPSQKGKLDSLDIGARPSDIYINYLSCTPFNRDAEKLLKRMLKATSSIYSLAAVVNCITDFYNEHSDYDLVEFMIANFLSKFSSDAYQSDVDLSKPIVVNAANEIGFRAAALKYAVRVRKDQGIVDIDLVVLRKLAERASQKGFNVKFPNKISTDVINTSYKHIEKRLGASWRKYFLDCTNKQIEEGFHLIVLEGSALDFFRIDGQ